MYCLSCWLFLSFRINRLCYQHHVYQPYQLFCVVEALGLPCGSLLHQCNELLGIWGVSYRHIQQSDRTAECLAVPLVCGGDVLRRHGPGYTERELQRGLLLQRGIGGAGRERVRQSIVSVRQSELRSPGWAAAVKHVRVAVSCGLLLPGRVCDADGVPCWAVLRECGSGQAERGMLCGVLLRRGEQHEPDGGGMSCGALLSCGDGGACEMSTGDVS